MTVLRIALANLRYPDGPQASVEAATRAIADAAAAGARLVMFPECFVPGYRWPTRKVPTVDAAFLEAAYASIERAAAASRIAVALGTERVTERGVHLAVLVVDEEGRRLGFQEKLQLDPPEEEHYVPGTGPRWVFEVAGVAFGIVICHEGFRYPETVRALARAGAQLVVHPHYYEAEDESLDPAGYADPHNTFHEKAALCRAAENTVFYATINCAGDRSPTTSAVIRPDGTLQCFQPRGQEGLLLADLDLALATRHLATRLRDDGAAVAVSDREHGARQ